MREFICLLAYIREGAFGRGFFFFFFKLIFDLVSNNLSLI